MGEKLSLEQRKELAKAEETILTTFNWSTSHMDYDFWAKVHRELLRIVETGEP